MVLKLYVWRQREEKDTRFEEFLIGIHKCRRHTPSPKKMAKVEKRKDPSGNSDNTKKPKTENKPSGANDTSKGELKKKAKTQEGNESVEELQEMRIAARAKKDWKMADALRDRIQAMGVKVQDSKIKDGAGSKLIPLPKPAPAATADDDDDDDDEDDDDVEGEDDDEEEEEEEEEPAPKAVAKKQQNAVKVLSMGVKIEDVNVGKGPPIEERQTVKVQYVGKLQNGKVLKFTTTFSSNSN
jgi:hypothetical protein